MNTNSDVTRLSSLLLEGRIPEAEALVEKAQDVEQYSVQDLLLLSQYAMSIGKLAASLSFIARASALEPSNSAYKLQQALVYICARQQRKASEICQDILKGDGGNVNALNMMASCHSSFGEFEEAERLYRTVLEMEPSHSHAIAGLAKCRRFKTDGEASVLLFKKSFAKPLDEDAKARVHFAIAKVFNDLGQYDDAWKHAKNANLILRMKSPFKRQKEHAKQIDDIIESHKKGGQRAAQSANKNGHILIVGMPRTGTTLMEQVLAGHETVFPGGEVPAIPFALAFAGQRFGVERYPSLSADQLNVCASAYERYFSELGASPSARIVNKVPYNYLYIGFFKAMFPNGKVIYMRRNLMDNLASIFFEHFSDPMSYSTDLNDILFVRNQSERLMAYWESALPDDVVSVQYEELVENFELHLSRVLALLNIKREELKDFREVNNAVETPSVWQVRQGVYKSSTERWRRYTELSKFAESIGYT